MDRSLLDMVTDILKSESSRGVLDVARSNSLESTHVFPPRMSGFEEKCANMDLIQCLHRSIVVEAIAVVVAAVRAVTLVVDPLPAGAQSLPRTSPMVSPPSSMAGPTHND